MHPPDGPILFYDGQCGLCDRSVRWVMSHDRSARFRFAPLQGDTYANLQRDDKPHDLSTLVLVDDAGLHIRSEAVRRSLLHVGGRWRTLARLLGVIPRPIRDAGYRFIARIRLRLFGGPEACRLPTLEERARLLP